ncbi:hypothetical protein [Salinicola sp. MIT1003]|jgi:hypothetical protein|uniref:hypothetical protein n=1 Tax=Salinicola sp. MIT1003 TaxID=1882734 RepID=UPI0014817EB7|nr:hypothetical protein [Salinicola sp. MIT1003]
MNDRAKVLNAYSQFLVNRERLKELEVIRIEASLIIANHYNKKENGYGRQK